jgi:undecaprenyl diphosphate synthase
MFPNETKKDFLKNTDGLHLAIIMDGNRRWAKEKGLPSAAGHSAGVESLKKTVKQCPKQGIKYLTVYAFSTENWQRKEEEVSFLMTLLGQVLDKEINELIEQGVRLRFIGELDSLNGPLKEKLLKVEKLTEKNDVLHLQVAFNYGARSEILQAVRRLSQSGIDIVNLTEERFKEFLYTSQIPDPDLLIRTGGEMRVSNFLLWQIAYSEIIVTATLWPDFNEKTLSDCLNEFNSRQRRFGV